MNKTHQIYTIKIHTTMLMLFMSLGVLAQPSFSKQFIPSTIGPGSHSQLAFTIVNNSANPVTQMNFTDNLPAGMVVSTPSSIVMNCNDGSLSAVAGGNTVSLTDGELAGNRSCTILVNVSSDLVGVHTNVTGDLTSSLGNSGTATDNLTVSSDLPGFSKIFSPPIINYGERSRLTFTIDNSLNSGDIISPSFADNLPNGMVVADPANLSSNCENSNITAMPNTQNINVAPISIGQGNIAAGSTCSISVDVKGNSLGQLDNVSNQLSFYNSVFQTQQTGFATSSLLVENAGDLMLTQNFLLDPVSPGGTVDLTFQLTNFSRTDAATQITFTNDLDATLTGLLATGLPLSNPCGVGSSLSGTNVLTLSGATLSAGEVCTFNTTLQIPAATASGQYINTTSVITSNEGSGAAVSESLFINDVPVLSKTFLNNTLGGGGTTSMEFSITNTSTTLSINELTFIDNISQFLSGASISNLPPAGFCGAGSSAFQTQIVGDIALQVMGANLAAGETCTFTVDLSIPFNVTGGNYINTTSNITGSLNGETVVGAVASDTLTVVGNPKLKVEFTNDPVQPGDVVNAKVVISYDALAINAATNIAFTWDLDATLTGLSAAGLPTNDLCGTGSTLTGTSSVSFTGGSLQPNEFCEFNLQLQVPASALPGSYLSTTSNITAMVSAVSTINSAAQDTLNISGIDFTKSFIDDPVLPGQTVVLEYTLDNTSTLDATDMIFTENLSQTLSGLTYIGPALTAPCGNGSSLTTSGSSFLIFTGGNLTAGTSCTFMLSLVVPGGAENGLYNSISSNLSATIDGTQLTLEPSIDALIVDSTKIDFSVLFTNDPVSAGQTVSIEYSLNNLDSNNALSNVSFSHDLPATLPGLAALNLPMNDVCGSGSVLADSGNGFLLLSSGSIPAAGGCDFMIDLQIPIDATAGNYPSLTSDPTGNLLGSNVTGNNATDVLTINSTALSLTMMFDNTTDAGRTTFVHYAVNNDSNSTVSGFRFAHNLESIIPGFVAAGVLPINPCGLGSNLIISNSISIENGTIAANNSCQFSVKIKIPNDQPFGIYSSSTSEITIAGEPIALAASDNLIIDGELAVLAARVADYWFNSDLTSEVTAAPDLLYSAPLSFVTDFVLFKFKSIFNFTDVDGFELLAGDMGVIDEYTLVMLVSISNPYGQVKLVDFGGLNENSGLMVNSTSLQFNGITGANGQYGTILPDEYVQIAISRSADGMLKGYVDGIEQFVVDDTENRATVNNFYQVMHLMKDDISTNSTENSAGKMARVTLFDVPFEQLQTDNFYPLGDIIFFDGLD